MGSEGVWCASAQSSQTTECSETYATLARSLDIPRRSGVIVKPGAPLRVTSMCLPNEIETRAEGKLKTTLSLKISVAGSIAGDRLPSLGVGTLIPKNVSVALLLPGRDEQLNLCPSARAPRAGYCVVSRTRLHVRSHRKVRASISTWPLSPFPFLTPLDSPVDLSGYFIGEHTCIIGSKKTI